MAAKPDTVSQPPPPIKINKKLKGGKLKMTHMSDTPSDMAITVQPINCTFSMGEQGLDLKISSTSTSTNTVLEHNPHMNLGLELSP